jgi:putative transposase
VQERKSLISPLSQLSIRHQCRLLNVHRSGYDYQPVLKDDTDLANRIAEIYQQYPVYGYRRITACLNREGLNVNRKRVLRIMQLMEIRAIYPGPKTTIGNPSHRKHPYLLKGLVITRPHQVWQIDITYLRTDHGFIYMNALIDVYSRSIVGWTLSNTLDAEHCIRTLEKAIDEYGLPDMINSDQGSQFTGNEWIQALESRGISISMSGRGRSNDNAHIERLWRTLKYEWTFINGARSVSDYKKLLPQFVHWYNHLRPHQSLGYKTPNEVLKEMPYGYMDKANALTHIPTRPTTTNEDSLNLRG